MKKTAEGRLLKEDVSNYDKDAFEKPSVTVDVAICTIKDDDLKVLLIKRKYPPFKDCWAIPGGFVNVEHKESLEETARRELEEETSLGGIYLEQLKTYGDPDRDPRMRIITTAYFALIPYESLNIKADDDAADASWFSLRNLPDVAFDHKTILTDLLNRLIGKISYSSIAFSLVPKKFTWNRLQKTYEIVLGKKLIPANFRRKIRSMYKLRILKSKEKPVIGRPSPYLQYIDTKKDF